MPRSLAPEPKHSAVLLAAGGSARLGQPKQALTIEGETLIRRSARLLAETGPERLIVIIGMAEMAEYLRDIPATIILNSDWKNGLSSSVRAAANALSGTSGSALFASVDQCRLQTEHLQKLLDATRQQRDMDVVCRYDPESFGIPALVSPKTQALAGALQGDRGFGQIWREARDRLVYVDMPDLAFDLDTPAQLAAAVKKGWIDGRKRAGPDSHETRLPGLRALKQSRVRTRMIDEAMRLFSERGFEDVTVDEIAACAGVSRRTLFRYFSTKGDIVFAWTETMTEVLRDTMSQRGADEQPGPALRRAFTAVIDRISPDPEKTYVIVRMIEESPALRIHSLRKYAAWEESITEAWRGQLPGDTSPFLAGRVLARGAIAAFRSALDEWLHQHGRAPFGPLLTQAFAVQHHIFDHNG